MQGCLIAEKLQIRDHGQLGQAGQPSGRLHQCLVTKCVLQTALSHSQLIPSVLQ